MQIELRDICVQFPGHPPLFKIKRYSIQQNSRILLSGASGIGKSTLLHLIAGLMLPSDGTINVGDFRLTSMSDEARCTFRRHHVGIIFQRLNLLEHLTAAENVQLGLIHDSKVPDKTKIDQVLKQVGLAHRKGQNAATLSLGEQQRVAVARVLAGHSEIFLADEPTSSLDDKNTDQIIQSLMKASENKTLIVVSHDDRIKKYFDETVVFQDLIHP